VKSNSMPGSGSLLARLKGQAGDIWPNDGSEMPPENAGTDLPPSLGCDLMGQVYSGIPGDPEYKEKGIEGRGPDPGMPFMTVSDTLHGAQSGGDSSFGIENGANASPIKQARTDQAESLYRPDTIPGDGKGLASWRPVETPPPAPAAITPGTPPNTWSMEIMNQMSQPRPPQ
jgi:hypothetical protein